MQNIANNDIRGIKMIEKVENIVKNNLANRKYIDYNQLKES